MQFEWDETKRARNIEKHDFDFVRAIPLLRDGYVQLPGRIVGGEKRWLAIGTLDDILVAVVCTYRGEERTHHFNAEGAGWRTKKISRDTPKLKLRR